MHYNIPPVQGMLYLELKTIPNRGNVVSTNIVFSPTILPFTAKTEGEFAYFDPEFNVGDIYTGAVEVVTNLDYAEHLPSSCSMTIINKKLIILFYLLPDSYDSIGYTTSTSDFIQTSLSDISLPEVITQRMDVTWLENNVLP